jgi:hypothetical protein
MITPVDRLFEAHLTVSELDASIAFYRDRGRARTGAGGSRPTGRVFLGRLTWQYDAGTMGDRVRAAEDDDPHCVRGHAR